MREMYFPAQKGFALTLLMLFTYSLNAQTTVDLAPSKDNTLYESATGALSNGKGISMFSGRTNQASAYLRRALIQFDIAGSIPSGSTITAVTLSLRIEKGAGNQTTTLHKISADWGEGNSLAGPTSDGDGVLAEANDATWIHRFSPSTNWTTAGGDFNASASASTIVGAAPALATWSSAQMVADVQSWLDNSSTNFGWLVKGNEAISHTAKSFSTREAAAANRPKLSIIYTPPCVQPTITSFSNPISLCEGNTGMILQVIGQLNGATSWKLYSGSCGGTLVTSNATGEFSVAPAITTTYFVRGEGGCATVTSCNSTTITVVPSEDPSFQYNANSYCKNDNDPTPTISGTTGGYFRSLSSGLSINSTTGKIDLSASAVGNYTIRYRTQGTCADSSDVQLTISNFILNSTSRSICPGDQFQFGSQTLTTAGQYTETFTAHAGCDSTVNLTLSLKEVFNTNKTVTICKSEQYSFGGNNLTTAGQYQHTFTSKTVGCDSTVNLTLQVTEINPTIIFTAETKTLQASPEGGTYQWVDCNAGNTNIAAETSQVYSPEESGSYAVRITKDNCTETSECHEVVITGIEEFNQSVTISPNPANGKIVVTFSEVQQQASIKLESLTGKTLFHKNFIHVERADVETQDLPAGLYLIRIRTEHGNKVARILIK